MMEGTNEEDMEASWPSLSCGVQIDFATDLPSAVDALVYKQEFGFIVTPVMHPRRRRDVNLISAERQTPATRSDLILESGVWNSVVVGKISDWIDCDSNDRSTAQAGEQAFVEEVLWATHLSMSAIVLPCPKMTCSNYASVVNRMLEGTRPAMWIKIPLTSPLSLQSENPDDSEFDPWFVWHKFRSLCSHSGHVGVLLKVTQAIPGESTIKRWLGEPVKALELPTSIFIYNSKGYPVLSTQHQVFFIKFFKLGVQVVLSGRPKHRDGLNPYYLYLQHLSSKIPKPTVKDAFEQPFYDYLQSPLQPLGDHLESQMYETFEKDPIKYQQYELAICRALEKTPKDKISVVMVVGAGRGPLVRASLRAAKQVQRTIRMYAIEKNPNAVVTLRNMKLMLGWGEQVQIVHKDMRLWDAPEMADILVSELLGSWGDNELSPECLDGAEKFLNPNGGISIPCEYTSFVEPITTCKLWSTCKDFDQAKAMETMYVVKLQKYSSFASPKPVFTFAHPSWNKGVDAKTGLEVFSPTRNHPKLLSGKIDNTRFRQVEFTAEYSGLLHGFGAYFEAKLFEDVMISINPPTHSPGMFSWFPIYIPIADPIVVRKGETIAGTFWRRASGTKVWYEWAITAPTTSFIHNSNGVSSPINLTTD